MRTAALVVAFAAALPACSNESPTPLAVGTPPPVPCAAGEAPRAAGGCLPAGVQPDGCSAGELGSEGGGCEPAGVPPAACGAGFAADDRRGCRAIVPREPCGDGLVAFPGETECHEIAPCGAGRWGDVPVDASTEHVDGSFAGPFSDGTADKPWQTIQQGIDAAAPDAIVAVAAGTYGEDLLVTDAPVRLWGKCPRDVEVVGAGSSAAVYVDASASGMHIRGIAVRGPATGVQLTNATGVTMDSVWIHDTAGPGLVIMGAGEPAAVDVRATLVERTREIGVWILGAAATIGPSAIRGTLPRASDGGVGWGVLVAGGADGTRGDLTLRDSVVEDNRGAGVLVLGSGADIETTLVRDTQPHAADESWGYGVAAHHDLALAGPAHATIRRSAIERNHTSGVDVMGSDVEIEATVVRETKPQPPFQAGGQGLLVTDTPEGSLRAPTPVRRSTLDMRSSVVEANHEVGVSIYGSDATIVATIVRETQPRPDGNYGWGLEIADSFDANQRGTLELRSSVIEHNHDLGMISWASDVLVEGTVVRDTRPRKLDGAFGWGIDMQSSYGTESRTIATMRWSVVTDNHDYGLVIYSSDVSIESSLILNTLPNVDGLSGDGVTVVTDRSGVATLSLDRSVVAASSRVGVASFGAIVSMGATLLDCNGIHLDGEPFGDVSYDFDDRGGNVCGCGAEPVVCKVLTTSLQPPEPIDD